MMAHVPPLSLYSSTYLYSYSNLLYHIGLLPVNTEDLLLAGKNLDVRGICTVALRLPPI